MKRQFTQEPGQCKSFWQATLGLVVIYLLLPLGACGRTETLTHHLSNQREFKAAFPIDLVKQYGADLEFAMISVDGLREPLPDVTWSEDDGSFRFVVQDSDFYPLDSTTPLDQIFAMGGDLPAFQAGRFSRKIIGQLRIEARPKEIPDQHNLVPYSQFILPLSRVSSFSSSETITVENDVPLQIVGASRVRVVDAEGQGIPQAKVAIYPHGDLQLEDQSLRPLWHSPIYRPIATLTNERGYADLLPLVDQGTFQIFVEADGYCSYMSEEMAFDVKVALLPNLVLQKCETLSEQMTFRSAWDSSVRTFEDKRLDGNAYSFAYTNEETLWIASENTSQVLRPMRVTVLEEPNEKADPCVYEGYPETRKIFTSRIKVKLPVQFYRSFCNSPTKGASGVFLVKLETLDSQGDVLHTQVLYGKKSTAIPPTVDKTKVTLANPLGVSNVLAGQNGSTFTIKSSIFCKPRWQLGVRLLGTSSILYSPCLDSLEAKFLLDDLKLPATQSTVARNIKLELFLKDEYANLSLNDESVNRINLTNNIFIDYGVPEVEDIRNRFTTHFGFASKTLSGLPAGTFLPSGTTTDTAILTPSTLSDSVFRFEPASSCATVRTDADGTGSPRPGAQIYGFALGASATAANSISSAAFQKCSQNGVVRDYVLKTGDIAFPNDPTASAVFFLRFIDPAGLASEARSFSIPPCPAFIEISPSNPTTPVCWRP